MTPTTLTLPGASPDGPCPVISQVLLVRRTLPKGFIIHLHSIPVALSADTVVETCDENWREIDETDSLITGRRAESDRLHEEYLSKCRGHRVVATLEEADAFTREFGYPVAVAGAYVIGKGRQTFTGSEGFPHAVARLLDLSPITEVELYAE